MSPMATVLDRIRKLLVHSDSAKSIGSAAEAEAFAAKAAEIALQHKLDLSEIEFAAEEAADPIDKERVNTADLMGAKATSNRSAWQQSLLSTLARNHSCLITVTVGSKSCWLIGASADREIVKYLYAVLAKEGEKLGTRHAREWAARTVRDVEWQERGKGSKRDFLLGYVRGIGEKLHAQRSSTLAEAGHNALVRVQTHDKAVGVWMYANIPGLGGSASLSGARKGSSFNAGKAAGLAANLNGGLGGGTTARASSMRLTA